ncbi:hypothetical protein K3495_g4957 [Podosphaera aphanis]|nr:hypothetical protein K3495_g4957 [Podosphaera aphanis]
MDGTETFTLLPIHMDPTSKAVTTTSESSILQKELQALNDLHRNLLNLGQPVPPPPAPVNPKHTTHINKLRDSGNTCFRQGKHAEAVRLYTLGIEMALKRPLWESCQWMKEEVAALYANRAQAHMAIQNWPEAAVDAEASVHAKETGNVKAWWRGGKSLLEMGRLREAREWLRRSLVMENDDPELLSLSKEVGKSMKVKKIKA